MSKPAPAPPADLAPALSVLAPAEPVRSAVQAAQRIHAVSGVMRALSVVAQIQLMESCWVIRSRHPERAAFDTFLADQGVDAVLAPDEAWAMALTHDVQRRHRTLRELVSERPAQAMRWVRGFVDAQAEARLEQLDERDEQVVSLLTSPPRAMRRRVRALLEMEAGERPPAPEAAAEAAPPPPPPAPAPADTPGIEACIEELAECVRRLDRLAAVLPDRCLAGPPGRARLDRIPLLADLGFGALERIADGAREGAERHG